MSCVSAALVSISQSTTQIWSHIFGGSHWCIAASTCIPPPPTDLRPIMTRVRQSILVKVSFGAKVCNLFFLHFGGWGACSPVLELLTLIHGWEPASWWWLKLL
uniref:Uncharacterized protein n=1 Tax=Eutreptiella gymnastica TaxID=73025 RepID=A0A7S4FT05_9EUGL